MNIKRIITEAINNTVLNNYVNTLEKQVAQLTKIKGIPGGIAYQYLCNLVAYCNEIKQSARNGNIEPTSNATTSSGGMNRMYFDPHMNLYNNIRGAGLEIPFLNGAWDSAVRGYKDTRAFLGFGKNGSSNQKIQTSQAGGKYPVRTLVSQLDNWKINYSASVAKDPNGSKVFSLTNATVNGIFKTIEDIKNALGNP